MKTMTPVAPATPASLVFAKGLFTRGTDAFGPEDISKALDVKVEQVPPIPFSEAELRRARELGQYLILQVNTTKSGKPLTMKSMNEQFGNALGDGKLYYDVDWYVRESFYTQDTPRLGWALVSREVIPGSTSEDYLAQTQAISDYLVNEVFAGEELPEPYQVAVDEFKNRKAELEKLRDDDWKKCAEECAGLKLNQFFRESPVEVIYGLIVQHQVNRERLLGDKYTWTQTRSSDGRLVSVGRCDADGVYVSDGVPGDSCSRLGVRFFRSAVPGSVS